MDKNTNKKKPKTSFFKKMYLLNTALVIVVVISAIALSWYSIKIGAMSDFITPLATIAGSAFVEQGAFSSVYAWKSKCENLHKYPPGDNVSVNL